MADAAPAEKQKIVFIVGSTHSGSTLLDLLLGNHPMVTSMGEIHRGIRLYDSWTPLCTCGEEAAACPVWGPVFEQLDALGPAAGYVDRYQLVVDAVRAHYGGGRVISDSSKWIGRLQDLHRSGRYDIRTIFLVKDVRAYTYSQMQRRNKPKYQGTRDPRVRFETSAIYGAWKWWTDNRRTEEGLERDGIDYLPLGYEELCFRPRAILEELAAFTGIDFLEDMLTPGGGDAHIIRGNQMRKDPDKLAEIRYDYRWLDGPPVINLATLPLLRRNRRLVYSRGRT